MEILLDTSIKANAVYLEASCGVRYWEDGWVDGVRDETGSLIPFREGDRWKLLIEIETGLIQNWPVGKTARVHYKVCDDGDYSLLDQDMKCLLEIEGYVPKVMCPKEDGWGDYVIMDIGRDGKIADWCAEHIKKMIR